MPYTAGQVAPQAFVQPFPQRASAASYQVMNAFTAQALQRPPPPPAQNSFYPMPPITPRFYQPYPPAQAAQNSQATPIATSYKPPDPETLSLSRANLRSAREARDSAKTPVDTSQANSLGESSGYERSISQTLLRTHRTNVSFPSTTAPPLQAQFTGPTSGAAPITAPLTAPPSNRSLLDRSRSQAPLPALPPPSEDAASRSPQVPFVSQGQSTSFSPDRRFNGPRAADSPESENQLNLTPERQQQQPQKSTPRRSPQIAPLHIDNSSGSGPVSLPSSTADRMGVSSPLSPTNVNRGPFSPTIGSRGPFSPTGNFLSPSMSTPSLRTTTTSIMSNNNAQVAPPPVPSTASKLLAQAKLSQAGIGRLPPPPPPAPGPQSPVDWTPPKSSRHMLTPVQAKGQSHSGFLAGSGPFPGSDPGTGSGTDRTNGNQPNAQPQSTTEQLLYSPRVQQRQPSQYAPSTSSSSTPAASIPQDSRPAAPGFSHFPFSLPAQETAVIGQTPNAPTSTSAASTFNSSLRRSLNRDLQQVPAENSRDAQNRYSSSSSSSNKNHTGNGNNRASSGATAAVMQISSQSQAARTLSPPAAYASASSGSSSTTLPTSHRTDQQHDSALSLGGTSSEDSFPPPPVPVRAPLVPSASMPLMPPAKPPAASSSAAYQNVIVVPSATPSLLANGVGGLPTAPPPPPTKPKPPPPPPPPLASRLQVQKPHSLLAAALRKPASTSASTDVPDGGLSSTAFRLESTSGSSASYYRPASAAEVPVPVGPKMEANAMLRPSSLVPPKSPTMPRKSQAALALSIAASSASASSSAGATGSSSAFQFFPSTTVSSATGGSSSTSAASAASSSATTSSSIPMPAGSSTRTATAASAGASVSASRPHTKPEPERGQLLKRTQLPSQVVHAPPSQPQIEFDPRTGAAKQTGIRKCLIVFTLVSICVHTTHDIDMALGLCARSRSIAAAERIASAIS